MDEMMMNMMFGGMGAAGGGGGQRRRRKGKDVGVAFPATLEAMYKGLTKEVPRSKTVLCPRCRGSGSNKAGTSSVCQQCRGQGARVAMRQIGPGMMQQMQVPCDACDGRGTNISDRDKCKECAGKQTAEVETPLRIVVQPGMDHNTQIPFPEEGDQSPEVDVPGDIVVVLQRVKHDRFTRDGNDLHMKKPITLAESICGFQFTIEHLDGHLVSVEHPAGKPIAPGEKLCVKGEGMPILNVPRKFGDLVIEFEVTFPERLEGSAVEALAAVLPRPQDLPTPVEGEDVHDCYMSRQPLDETRKELEKEDDDDDDEEGGQGGVRCAHQ